LKNHNKLPKISVANCAGIFRAVKNQQKVGAKKSLCSPKKIGSRPIFWLIWLKTFANSWQH
jgi:hypothetical protein